jgi:hypothetical protein
MRNGHRSAFCLPVEAKRRPTTHRWDDLGANQLRDLGGPYMREEKRSAFCLPAKANRRPTPQSRDITGKQLGSCHNPKPRTRVGAPSEPGVLGFHSKMGNRPGTRVSFVAARTHIVKTHARQPKPTTQAAPPRTVLVRAAPSTDTTDVATVATGSADAAPHR